MTQKELKKLFDKHDREYLKFENVGAPRRRCPDVHAFLLLEECVPAGRDMINSVAGDHVVLSADVEILAEIATEEMVVNLIRCGVNLEDGCLRMYI